MNNKCKYLKQKFNNKLECKIQNKIIKIYDCSNCKYKEYDNKKQCSLKKKTSLKNRTYKQIKKEKARFSIIYTDLTKCAKCSSKIKIEQNEVFEGAKRSISIKYGFVIPLCKTCHTRFHNDREFALSIKKHFQKEYEKEHTRDEFINIIHRNYLD